MITLYFFFQMKTCHCVRMELIKSMVVVLLYNSLLREAEAFFFRKGVEWISKSVGISGCTFVDCCDKEWSRTDFEDFHKSLLSKVYGQNIALDVVVPALSGHLLPETPKSKALVMSFHGRPGIGKNFLANYIQQKIFEKRGKSKHVHFFSGRTHFPLQTEVNHYRIMLINLIKNSVSECEYSLFIFDEVDKMPPGVLDALTPFIDHHDRMEGIDFRKATFILISNTGGDLITQKFLEFWKIGKKRESLRLADFENLIMVGAFNEKGGGLYKSDTIEGSLIDHYVPFLPLEERHVRQCVKDQFEQRHITTGANDYMEEIIGDLTFGPDDNPILSNSGCKRIAPKVAAIAERAYFRRQTEL